MVIYRTELIPFITTFVIHDFLYLTLISPPGFHLLIFKQVQQYTCEQDVQNYTLGQVENYLKIFKTVQAETVVIVFLFCEILYWLNILCKPFAEGDKERRLTLKLFRDDFCPL